MCLCDASPHRQIAHAPCGGTPLLDESAAPRSALAIDGPDRRGDQHLLVPCCGDRLQVLAARGDGQRAEPTQAHAEGIHWLHARGGGVSLDIQWDLWLSHCFRCNGRDSSARVLQHGAAEWHLPYLEIGTHRIFIYVCCSCKQPPGCAGCDFPSHRNHYNNLPTAKAGTSP